MCCNVLIVEREQQTIQQILSFMQRYEASTHLLPIIQTDTALQRIACQQSIGIAIINVELAVNCFEWLHSLRTQNANVQIIFIANNQSFSIGKKVLRYGCVDYLTKPLDVNFKMALARAMQRNQQQALPCVKQEDSRALQLRQQVLNYIHEYYQQNITLTSLADALYLSRYHTSRLVKKILGMTFSQYLLMYRLEVAKRKLTMTDCLISEVATSVGFNDPNYFGKKFKESTTYTPKQYRKLYQKTTLKI